MHKEFVRIECEVSDSQKYIKFKVARLKTECVTCDRIVSCGENLLFESHVNLHQLNDILRGGKQKRSKQKISDQGKIKGHIRRPLLKNNLMRRTVFSIQTESRQERSQS